MDQAKPEGRGPNKPSRKWFSNLGGLKMLLGTVIFIAGFLLFLSCYPTDNESLKLLLKLQLAARQSRRCSCYNGTMDAHPSLKNPPELSFSFPKVPTPPYVTPEVVIEKVVPFPSFITK